MLIIGLYIRLTEHRFFRLTVDTILWLPEGLFQTSIHSKDKLAETKPSKASDVVEIDHQVKVRDEMEHKSIPHDRSLASLHTRDLNHAAFWQPKFHFGGGVSKQGEEEQKGVIKA